MRVGERSADSRRRRTRLVVVTATDPGVAGGNEPTPFDVPVVPCVSVDVPKA